MSCWRRAVTPMPILMPPIFNMGTRRTIAAVYMLGWALLSQYSSGAISFS
jgi:hypothetical protein